jgi:hypothetical protein
MAKLFSGAFFKNLGRIFGGNNWVFAVLTLVGLFTKKKKKPEEINNKSTNSPTYSWEGVTTTADTDLPVPLIYGRHQVGGNIVNTHIKSEMVENVQNELIKLTSITSADDITNKRISYVTPSVNGTATKSIQFDVVNSIVDPISGSGFTNNADYSEVEYDDIYIEYKKSTDTTWTALPAIKANAISVSSKITLSFNTDSTYDGTYHIRLSHQGVIKHINGVAKKQTISSYNRILINNAYKYVTYYVGTNASTAQTLYLDVALGVGQLEGILGIQVNDQYIADYTSEKDIDKKSVRIKHEFKSGHDLLVPFNKNDFVTVQSAVFNKNLDIKRVCRTTLSENATKGTNILKVIGASLMFDDYGHRSHIRLYDASNNYHDYTIATLDGDNVTLSSNLTESYNAGVYVYAPDETQIAEYNDTGEFTNFTYTTQADYVDAIDVGLSAYNGLFIVDANGNYTTGRVSYELWVAYQTTPIQDIETTHIHHEVVNLIGGREGRIWYNKVLGEDVLTVNPANKKKQYHIKLKKLNRDNYENIAKNDLQIAYIEEIKNKDIYYNNTGYVSLIMPADPKLNGGNPTFKFEVEGLHVPCLLPPSLVIDAVNSNDNTIYLENTGSIINYNDGDTDYQLSVLAGYIGSQGQKIDLDNWLNVLTCTTTPLSSKYKGKNILTAYFKCGDKWYKKYCILKTNAYADQIISADIEAYKSKIVLLTDANITALKTEYAAVPELVALFTELSYIYKETALPSTPTNMVLYKWSDNPAECILHLLTNEDNGLGIPFEQIDLDYFVAARDYFNEQIPDPLNSPNTMKRCMLNMVLDTVDNARAHIDNICATCHSALYETNGKIRIIVDREAEEPLTNLNEDLHLISDSLKVISLPAKELPNQINITYLNKDNNYSRDPITVEDPKLSRSIGYGSLRKMEMDLRGITDESHAYLEGLRLIKTARYTNFSISFKTALSGFPFEIGDVFRLESTTFGWGTLDGNGEFIAGTGKRFKIMTVKHAENLETDITAVEYYDEIYTLLPEDLVTYNTVRHTSLPNPSQKPMAVKNLVLREENFRNVSGDITLSIVGHFNPPNTASLIPNNRVAFIGVAGSIGHTILNLKSSDEAKRFKAGDKIAFNTDLVAGDDDSGFHTVVTSYGAGGLNQIVITPALAAVLPVDSFISKMEYSMTKYEYNKFDYAIVDLYDNSTGNSIIKGFKSDNNSFKLSNIAAGTYTCVVHSVSARGIVGDYASAVITVVGKLLLPEDKSTTLTATMGSYKNKYLIAWEAATDRDIRNYKLTITPNFASPVIATVTKTIIYPLEYTHTFTTSGAYTLTLTSVNTSGIESIAASPLVLNVVIDLTENITLSYTLRGNLIVASWTPVEVATELVRYAIYIRKTTPFATEGGGEFDPDTNPYLESDYQGHKVWEGTSTQISIGNLTDGSIITYDEPYHLFVLAKYKYNGVEKVRHAVQVKIEPVSDANASVLIYAVMPDIVDGILAQDNLKVYAVAIPDAAVTRVYGTLERYVDGEPMVTLVEFTKNVDDLWEYDFTDLVDADWTLYIYGEKVTDDKTATVQLKFTVDTSIPAPLPRPYITKDNTYVQTQTLSYSATLTTPISNGETIDIYNSKTIQVCLPTFTTCTNFSHIKMYLREYDSSTKSWGAYTEYKLPQSPLQEEQIVPNFKASVTFAEDMPDFQIKLVQVKKTGLEGVLGNTLASLRSKIDTTPPLIKINSIAYDGDTASFNAVNNNYINAKLNVGLGLLLNLAITENNSGLWSNMVDEALLRMPVYYQINNGTKTPLKNASGLYANTFLIPKAAFTGINEGEKVNITIFALDNALKLGNTTFTKILDTTAPHPVTLAKAVFGVEANAKVIKFRWTASVSTDVAGVRIYEGTTLIKETTGTSASIPTTDGTTRNFVLRAYDFANNESEDLAVSAVNYKPAKVTGLLASSDSSSVSLKWTAVTLDTDEPPELMTDLDYYEVSYYNPNTGTTVTAQTKDTHFYIPMTASDMAYFNTYLNQYITDIKVRAIDIFGGVSGTGDWSATTIARPRFIEAVDMTQNIFKFVPSLVGCTLSSGSLEYLVDANYKNDEPAVIANISQGDSIHIDMKPEYVAETKVKFYGATTGVNSYIKFLIKYRVIDPVTRVESDLYIQSASGYNDLVHLETNGVADYARHLKVKLTNAGTDKENTFVISLFQSSLVRQSYYIKAVDLIFASNDYASIGVCELQPRVRSIANDFYGETMLLSNMLAIRSSEDTTNYLNMTSTYLEMHSGGSKSLVLGDLANVGGSGYGLWAKDKIYLGGTTAATANFVASEYSLLLGCISTNVYNMTINSYGLMLGFVSGLSYNLVIDSTSIKLGYTGSSGWNTYYNTKIESGIIYLGHISSGTTYNTVITSGAISLGYLGSGPSYALVMDYSSATEANRYFSIKGSDLSEYFRIGMFTAAGINRRSTWMRRWHVSSDYTADTSDSTGNVAYTYIRRTDDATGLFIVGNQTSAGILCYNLNSTAISGVSSTGYGILGSSGSGNGVHGSTSTGVGVFGIVSGIEGDGGGIAVYGWGTTSGSIGVKGKSDKTYGVYGESIASVGIYGVGPVAGIVGSGGTDGIGVEGNSSKGIGVKGNSTASYGIYGTTSGANQSAVVGYTTATNSNGVHGESVSGRGVNGYSATNNGVVGRSGNGNAYGGLFQGASTSGYALRTEARVIMTNLSIGTGTALVIDSNEVKVSSSSIRYKTLLDRADVDFTVNKFMSLVPYKFRFNISGDYDLGFIAEHILPIFPDLVLFNSDGQPEALKYDRFCVYNILATQEHQREIISLKSEIDALKTSIEELKKLVDNLMNK